MLDLLVFFQCLVFLFFEGFELSRLLIQRCTRKREKGNLFDQHSFSSDESEFCPMNGFSARRNGAFQDENEFYPMKGLYNIETLHQFFFMPLADRDLISLHIDRIASYIINFINIDDIRTVDFKEGKSA